jgi:hypothetical protein
MQHNKSGKVPENVVRRAIRAINGEWEEDIIG